MKGVTQQKGKKERIHTLLLLGSFGGLSNTLSFRHYEDGTKDMATSTGVASKRVSLASCG